MPVNLITFTNRLISNPGIMTENAQVDSTNVYNGIRDHKLRMMVGRRYQSFETAETKNFGPRVITSPTPVFFVDDTFTDVSNTYNVFFREHL